MPATGPGGSTPAPVAGAPRNAGFGGARAAGGTTPRGETPAGARTAARARPRGASVAGWDYWWNANKWLQLSELNLLLRTARNTTPSSNAAATAPDALAQQRKRDLAHALPALQRALTDSFSGNRAAAAIALGKCGGPAALPLLLNALKDSSAEVQRSALIGLGLLGRDEAEVWLLSVARDEASARPLLASTGAVDGDTRKVAVLALGFLQGKDGAQCLNALAASDQTTTEDLRLCALTALGVRGDAASAPLLIRVAAEAGVAERVRAAATVALGKLGDTSPMVVRALLGLLQDRKTIVVQAAAAAMADLGATTERAALVHALGAVVTDHSDVLARAFALMALARMGGKEAVALATQHLGRSGVLEGYAPLALALASRNTDHAVAARVALQSACEAARDDQVRAACCVALGIVGGDDSGTAAKLARSEASPDTRTGAVIALGLAANSAHAELLANLLADDPDHELRHEAALGLALAAPRHEAAAALLAVLARSTSSHEAAGCAFALGLCSDSSTVQNLSTQCIATDAAPLTRAWSSVALGVALDAAPFSRLARLRANNLYWSEEPVLRALLQSL